MQHQLFTVETNDSSGKGAAMAMAVIIRMRQKRLFGLKCPKKDLEIVL